MAELEANLMQALNIGTDESSAMVYGSNTSN